MCIVSMTIAESIYTCINKTGIVSKTSIDKMSNVIDKMSRMRIAIDKMSAIPILMMVLLCIAILMWILKLEYSCMCTVLTELLSRLLSYTN